MEGITCGYCLDIQVIYLNNQLNTEIRLPRSNLDDSPQAPPPQYITFSPFISQIFLLNIKDVEFDFRWGYIFVLFPFLLIINMQFTNFWIFYFLFFKINVFGLLWSKITIFIIEITIKLFYIQNIDEITLTQAGWAWKIQNFTFLPFLSSQNSSHSQTIKYMSHIQFPS